MFSESCARRGEATIWRPESGQNAEEETRPQTERVRAESWRPRASSKVGDCCCCCCCYYFRAGRCCDFLYCLPGIGCTSASGRGIDRATSKWRLLGRGASSHVVKGARAAGEGRREEVKESAENNGEEGGNERISSSRRLGQQLNGGKGKLCQQDDYLLQYEKRRIPLEEEQSSADLIYKNQPTTRGPPLSQCSAFALLMIPAISLLVLASSSEAAAPTIGGGSTSGRSARFVGQAAPKQGGGRQQVPEDGVDSVRRAAGELQQQAELQVPYKTCKYFPTALVRRSALLSSAD